MGILSSLFGIGGTGKQATTTQVIQSQIPKELSPFVKQILSEAQALYGADIERGYDPYTPLTTAPFTAEQLQAQEDIKGLRGTQAPFIQDALDIQREGAEKFTPEVAKEYMSPFLNISNCSLIRRHVLLGNFRGKLLCSFPLNA